MYPDLNESLGVATWIDAEQVAREQAEYMHRRLVEHAAAIEEALMRWKAHKSTKLAHQAFVESRTAARLR